MITLNSNHYVDEKIQIYKESLTIEGDLTVNEGCTLQIEGELNVRGQIRGEGEIIVAGTINCPNVAGCTIRTPEKTEPKPEA